MNHGYLKNNDEAISMLAKCEGKTTSKYAINNDPDCFDLLDKEALKRLTEPIMKWTTKQFAGCK